ncbi:MAG: hypothetical protein PHX19_03995 [Bacilli bacterium]|nr:hypothetical protein [Bacilli bacterium]MDD4408188.1 hypothetical protein [Bacilli bacterium]
MTNKICDKEKRCGQDNFLNNAFIILVLFILLAIILGAALRY